MAAQIGSDELEIDGNPRLDLLIEVAGIDPEPGREWARLEGPSLGFRSTQRLRVGDCPDGLVVTTWPAELADQARYPYRGHLGTPLVTAALDLEWTVEATPHIAYHRAAPDRRLYLRPSIALLQSILELANAAGSRPAVKQPGSHYDAWPGCFRIESSRK